MSDYISRKALLEKMNAYKFDTENDVARRTEHTVKAHMFELVENQPTAFDLDNVFQKITELQLSVKDKELTVNDEEYATMLRGRLRGIADVLEILKSAANTTNGKNGG